MQRVFQPLEGLNRIHGIELPASHPNVQAREGNDGRV